VGIKAAASLHLDISKRNVSFNRATFFPKKTEATFSISSNLSKRRAASFSDIVLLLVMDKLKCVQGQKLKREVGL